MVVFSHATATINFPPWLFTGRNTLLSGRLGVQVFFVISGFLITTLLLKEEQRYGQISLAGFYKRRALRILPVYFFYILIVAVVFSWMGLNSIPASTYLSALTFTARLWGSWGGASWPLGHFWSLAIEEQFYLIWPVVLVFSGVRMGGRILVPALILMAPMLRFLARDKTIVDMIFPMQGDCIAFGCLLALAFIRRPSQMQRLFQYHPHLGRLGALALIYLQRIVVIPLSQLHYDTAAVQYWFPVFWPTLQCIGIAYLIGSLTTVHHGLSYKLLNLEPIQWIGRLSYSLYIWHQMFMLRERMTLIPDNWLFAKWIGSFPQNVIAAFVLATLSYYFLEKPILSLKDRIEKNRQPKEKEAFISPAIQPHPHF